MNALILDDEYTAAEYLSSLVKKNCPEIETITTLTSPLEALSEIAKGKVDVLLTDIEMDEMSGLDLVEHIGDENMPAVIFTTAYNQYAIDGFRAHAVDYLLKPVNPGELKEAVVKALRYQKGGQRQEIQSLLESNPDLSSDRLIVADGQDYHIIDLADIIRAEGSGNYTTFYLVGERKLNTSRGLKYFEKKLSPQHGFIRTHQSHLANLAHAIKYSKSNGGELYLRENQRSPVSSRLRHVVQQSLGLGG